MKKKHVTWLLVGAACMGLGISMPSCPGQQAMQQQIDSLQTTNMDLSKKVQALTTQVQTLNSDISQVKTLLPQMTNVISGQKGALDKLENDVKTLQSKMASKGGKRR